MLSIHNPDSCILSRCSLRCSVLSFCKSLLVSCFLLNIGTLSVASYEFVNISIPLTSPSMIYTPFVCNSTEVSLNPQLCEGAWKLSEDSTQNVDMSTTGPSRSKNILPQLFFQFRASTVFLTTSDWSNATVDITVSSDDFVRSFKFDSSLGSATIADLPHGRTILFTLTVNSSTPPLLLDLTSISISIPPDATLSPVLPAPTIPPSASLPIVSLVRTQTPESDADRASNGLSRNMIGQAVGLTVGLGLGLTLLVVVLFYSWKWRRKRKKAMAMGNI